MTQLFIKVEINPYPMWSYLWFYPENLEHGYALVTTDNPKIIELLKQLDIKLQLQKEYEDGHTDGYADGYATGYDHGSSETADYYEAK